MHDRFCAQTIARLFGASYHPTCAQSLLFTNYRTPFRAPSHPPNARSLLCQNLLHTSSLPPVTHLSRSLHRPSHPACAPSLLCPKPSHTYSARPITYLMHDHFCAKTYSTPLRCPQSPTFHARFTGQSPCLCTITSVPQTIAHLTPALSRSSLPPKQSCSSWARPVTHLVHDYLCPKHAQVSSPRPVIHLFQAHFCQD